MKTIRKYSMHNASDRSTVTRQICHLTELFRQYILLWLLSLSLWLLLSHHDYWYYLNKAVTIILTIVSVIVSHVSLCFDFKRAISYVGGNSLFLLLFERIREPYKCQKSSRLILIIICLAIICFSKKLICFFQNGTRVC